MDDNPLLGVQDRIQCRIRVAPAEGFEPPDRLIKRLQLAPDGRLARSLRLYSDSSPGAASGPIATGR
jgi:hypothetical protein